MLKSLNLLAFLFITMLAFSQSKATINITGFTPEVEAMIIKGDLVSFFPIGKNGLSKNANVQVINSLGRKKFFASFDIKPDENGHYDFSDQIEIKEGPSLSFEGELELIVWIETIFGNTIWTKVQRTKETLGDPIILDKYTDKEGSLEHAKNKLELRFDCIGYNDELKAKVTSNGDSWKGRKIHDFHFLLKNEGDDEWKINLYCTKGSVNNKKQANARLVNDNLIDFTKPIVYRAETRTLNGNMLWHEEVIEPRGLNKVYFASNYTKLNEGEWENIKNNTPPPAQAPVTAQEVEPVEDPIEIIEDEEEIIEVEEVTPENSEETIKETPEIITEGATDLTTKTLSAKCAVMQKGDTLVLINGTNVCLKGVKPAGSRAKIGTLAMDCNFEVGENVFPLKGGSSIKFNTKNGSLALGTVREATKVSTSAGQFTIKANSEVSFNGSFFTSGQLLENATIEINGIPTEITPNHTVKRDIRFDGNGDFVAATLVKESTHNAIVDLTFPPLSRVIYKNGKLKKVFTPDNTTFDLNGKTITAKGSPNPAAYEFDKENNLISIIAGPNNIVSVNGQDVKVKEGKEIRFERIMTTYRITKFFAAENVTITLKKGSKMKEVSVKAGKKIVLDEQNR